jgi:hypothetical protein
MIHRCFLPVSFRISVSFHPKARGAGLTPRRANPYRRQGTVRL